MIRFWFMWIATVVLFALAMQSAGCAVVQKKALDAGRAALQCAPSFASCIAEKFREMQSTP